MRNELIKYAKGEAVPSRVDREVARQAREVYNEVRIAGVEVDGAMALADHIMERAVELDGRRRSLAEDDPAINMMLTEIEVTAIRQAKHIQAGLFSGW